MTPPWMTDGKRRRRQNEESRKQEKERAEQTNGRTQPGSGSSYRQPEDVLSRDSLEQLKFTRSKRFTIDVREWDRIAKHALRLGRAPSLIIDFKREDGRTTRLKVTEEAV